MMTLRAVKFAAALILALGGGRLLVEQGCGRMAGGAGGFGAGGAATPGSAQDFVVNVGDRVFFEIRPDRPDPHRRATLDKQAAVALRYPQYTFLIEGHADERGTREYNFSLGARRAQAVRDYLASRGIPAARIRTVSYGKERPVAVCNDISCWSQNRRAVTVLDAGAGS